MRASLRVKQKTTLFTLLVSVGVALAFPAIYLVLTYNYTLGSLEAQAEISAQTVSTLVSANPRLWRFETVRLEELLARQPAAGQEGTRRVFDESGTLVAEHVTDLRWPTIKETRKLYFAGTPAGRIEISQSLLPMVERAGLLALLGLVIGLGVFRLLPFRALLRAWQELQEANECLQGVMDGSTNAFLVLDASGRIQMVNGRCTDLTGYPAERLLGQPFEVLFQGGALEQVQASLGRVLGTVPEAARFETELTALDGRGITVACGVRSMARRGSAPSLVVSLEDITERKQAEDVRHRVDKLESVGLLAGGIAHDFNNLLTGILGNITLVKVHMNPEERSYVWLGNAEKASVRAAELTRQLLTFAKGGAPVKKRTAMGRLVQESAELAIRGANVRCVFAIPAGLWPCEVDEGQIHQVVNNLVINATQAMPDGGVITVTLENIRIAEDPLFLLKPGSYLKIAVRDEGSGMARELLTKIFSPYFTTKAQGNGLGLATSFSIIKRHGGSITVDSEPGAGSTFTVHLPALETGARDTPEEGRPILSGTGRILVMDDEEMIRETTMAMLQSLGYTCAAARDGVEAIAMYGQAAEARLPFAAVIMDLTIPGGMGGKEAIARLREQDPRVKAIVSSGYSESTIMSDYAEAGFAGVLRKPYKLEDMSSSLARILGASA